MWWCNITGKVGITGQFTSKRTRLGFGFDGEREQDPD